MRILAAYAVPGEAIPSASIVLGRFAQIMPRFQQSGAALSNSGIFQGGKVGERLLVQRFLQRFEGAHLFRR